VIGIFRAGSRFPYGVGIVCGTGFNAGGISEDGVEFRLPALGGFTGDYAGGGGEHVSVRGIGSGFRSWDGRGEKTMLQEAVLKHFGAPNYEALAEMYVQRKVTNPMIRSFAPVVFELSAAGDAVAQTIIRDEGIELGTGANAILRRLNLTDTDCDVVLGGSLTFGKGSLLMDTVREVVHKQSPRALVKRLDVPPVVGAVLLAADSIGLAIDEPFVKAIKESLPAEMQVPSTLEE
jgi:N-acetylglucosamine kinase-like BadF-type ATPase